MKLSVIVCAYNSEATLKKCLDSVCGQSYQNLEIILVNDGSVDGTLALMQQYAVQDNRIRIIDQENKGAGLAKNAGLQVVTGDYLTFVDSDDWIEPETFQDAAANIEKTKCDMLVFNHNRIYGEKTVRDVRPMKAEVIHLEQIGRDRYILQYIISYNHDLGACNKIVRSDIIKNHRIAFSDNKKMIYDDNMYSLKLISHVNTISVIPKSYYNYVIQENSVTGMKNTCDKLADGYTALFEAYTKYLEEIGQYEEFRSALVPLYYSMVYFGLVRLKHFGHFDVRESLPKLSRFRYYYDYMEQMNHFSVRFRYVWQTLRKVNLLRNWQLTGLIVLTQIQGKVIAHYAQKNDYEKLNRFI